MTDSTTARPPGLRFEIVLQDPDWPVSVVDLRFLNRIGDVIGKFVDIDTSMLAVVAFSSDAHVRTLNKQYRGKDKATNVLSFPAAVPVASYGEAESDENDLIGDIVLAHETVALEARAQSCDPVQATEHHTAHLIVHGILHLLGYDHDDRQSAEEMEALEVGILAGLGVANPFTEELDDVE
ncbi:MAG: rRNA maturation RNase YbeY [Hyphomicrobiaceae bacterium]